MPRQWLMGLMAIVAMSFATTVHAQPSSPNADLARAAEVQAKALKGWPGGIVFTCAITPVDLASAPVKQICAQAAANAGALAGQSKVKITQAADAQAFRQLVQRDRALGLTVQIGPSDFNAPVAVLVIRIFASRYY